MQKKTMMGVVGALGILVVLNNYRRHKSESFGWFAYAPLVDTAYNPTPQWVLDPQNHLETLRADFYDALYEVKKLSFALARNFDPVYFSTGDAIDFPVSNFPEEKLSPQLAADLRAWAAHYQQHATNLYDYPTSEWDSSEALEAHVRNENQLYERLRTEVPFWRQIVRSDCPNEVVRRRYKGKSLEDGL